MFPPWMLHPRDTSADLFAIVAGNHIRRPRQLYMTKAPTRPAGSGIDTCNACTSGFLRIRSAACRARTRKVGRCAEVGIMSDDVHSGTPAARLKAAADEASAAAAPPASDMIRIPAGEFLMGSERHYPEEAPVHRVRVNAFWMDRTPVTNREFRRFVEATGYVTFAEIAPDPKDYPGALPHMLKAGSLVFTPPKHPVDLRDWSAVVELQVPRQLAAPVRAGQLDPRARRSSRRARRLPGRRGVRPLGRQGAADRGRVGVRRARRSRRRRVRLGRRVHARRTADGQHLAGRVSARKPEDRRLRAHLARDRVSAERLRPVRHDRQRLGMDHRLVFGPARGRRGKFMLRRGQESARRATRKAVTTPASPTSASRARC